MSPLPVVSTYRLQLHAGFTFDDVRAIVPYLVRLGVTHLYLSPLTAATPGTTHGYDVVDPARVHDELGGQEGYERLVRAQRDAGLGQLVDTVPNHMGIGAGSGNRYWEDLLRHGRDAARARWFDIDWVAAERDHGGRVLLPFLDDELGAVIARGELKVEPDEGGWLRYGPHRWPLRPGSLDRWRQHGDIGVLVAEQHYLPVHWRRGKNELTYRRFFAIDDLIGVHAEEPEVFEGTHALLLKLVRDGAIDGLRIDHIDGLRDPEAYLASLRSRLDAARERPPYLVVEKILERTEELPDGWACDGTTGYDFLNEVTRVLTDARGAATLSALHERIVGPDSYEDVADRCRADVLHGPLARQFSRFSERLHAELAASSPAIDIDRDAFVAAMQALLARITVYRTYHSRFRLDPGAGAVVAAAVERVPFGEVDSTALAAAAAALATPPPGAIRDLVCSLQQIMPALQAKGQEDRAFFRYRRLIATNDVGGAPSVLAESVEDFHKRQAGIAAGWPQRMLATATHDHKLGEDVRARLVVLAELPELWQKTVEAGLAALDRLQADAAVRIHPADCYLMWQALSGMMPVGMEQGREQDGDVASRLARYMVKALREAEERTAWIDGDPAYEDAMTRLVHAALVDEACSEALAGLLHEIAPAGALNSLTQLLLRLTIPGVADTYQGNELWDLTTVDPDNRRAVDFAIRADMMRSLAPLLGVGPEANVLRRHHVPELLSLWRSGAIKMFVLGRTLHLRRERPELFLAGEYRGIDATGEADRHVIAWQRSWENQLMLVVAPRFPATMRRQAGPELDGVWWTPRWRDTRLALPPETARIPRWTDWLTGGEVIGGGELRLDAVIQSCPVSILVPATA